MTLDGLAAAIRSAGRTPVRRDTLYNVLAVDEQTAPASPARGA
jgi:2-iminoacetate synthase ThiH